jgi:hypothetical protein
MAMWRCPHCGTPQAETARCWVCRRSSTACASCRHFRRSVAAQLGYCGLDRERRPLRGDEIRACWEASAVPVIPDDAPVAPVRRSSSPSLDIVLDRTPVRKLEFIDIDPTPIRGQRRRRAAGDGIAPAATADGPGSEVGELAPAPSIDPSEPRWSLWGDAEV